MHGNAIGWPHYPRRSVCDTGGGAPVLASFTPSAHGSGWCEQTHICKWRIINSFWILSLNWALWSVVGGSGISKFAVVNTGLFVGAHWPCPSLGWVRCSSLTVFFALLLLFMCQRAPTSECQDFLLMSNYRHVNSFLKRLRKSQTPYPGAHIVFGN